jgi:hypothetical protein
MNHSEYLRRKLERIPSVIGPARPGDESMRIMEVRFKASIRRAPVQPPVETCCRGPTPYWRSGGGRPDTGPYPRAADGQQQIWSSEFIAASRAGCAICAVGRPETIVKPCCPLDPEPEPERAKPLALQGKQTCCPAVGDPFPALDCSCELSPGHINTLLANDMPSDNIPYPVPIRNCRRCSMVIDECECGGC